MQTFGQAAQAQAQPAQTHEARLATLKKDIASGQKLQGQLEGQIKEKQSQRDKYLAELATLGVTPENLETEIASLRVAIDQDLAEAESKIPRDLLQGQA